MKFCFSLLIILYGFVAQGQDSTKNFIIDNREIIWQKIFETKLSFDELSNQIKDKAVFNNLFIENSKLSGELRQVNADFKGAGFSEMVTPIYISRSHIDAYASIEYKEGRYRVTIKKIVLTQSYDDALTKRGEKSNLELYAVKNGQITAAFKKSPSTILDFTFNELFYVKQYKDKDW